MYMLYTNDHPLGRIVKKNPRPGMYDYIRRKMDAGMRLSQIIYTWRPVNVTNN
jgi:hypothetical protein